MGRLTCVALQAVQQWGEFVPEGIAYKLEKKTSGALKAMEQHYGEQQCKRRTIKSSTL